MVSHPNPPRRSLFAVWHWPRWTWVVVVVIGLLSTYVLGVAPAIHAYRAGIIPHAVYARFYFPLWIASREVGAQNALIWYCNLWGLRMQYPSSLNDLAIVNPFSRPPFPLLRPGNFC